MSTIRNKQFVIESICKAIRKGRDANGNWAFPTDCICHPTPEGWSHEYDQGFLDGLCDAITTFTMDYRKGENTDFYDEEENEGDTSAS